MVRVGIVEDDSVYVEQIQEYLSRYTRENGETFSVSVFRNGMQLAFDYQPVYDILLMDVEMPVMDGISAAQRIRKVDKDVIILFITNMAQYAIDGYSVRARAYILKPINYYGFSLELQEAIASLARCQVDSLLLTTDEGYSKIPIGKIAYVESQKHDLILHTTDGTICIRAKMAEMEERLQGFYFSRSSISYLVNLAHVTGISGNPVLDVVLTEKSLYCDAHQINMTCLVDGKMLDFIDTVDLYTIFGNALDNAIESVMQQTDKQKRVIQVAAYEEQGMLLIRFRNYCDHAPQIVDGLPATSKADTDYHCFGLKSIRHTAEAYGGGISMVVFFFVNKIIFPQTPKE